jgi:hypothetical protein
MKLTYLDVGSVRRGLEMLCSLKEQPRLKPLVRLKLARNLSKAGKDGGDLGEAFKGMAEEEERQAAASSETTRIYETIKLADLDLEKNEQIPVAVLTLIAPIIEDMEEGAEEA